MEVGRVVAAILPVVAHLWVCPTGGLVPVAACDFLVGELESRGVPADLGPALCIESCFAMAIDVYTGISFLDCQCVGNCEGAIDV